MSIKIIPITCPNCGANITIPADKDYVFCTYCGTKIKIDDDSIKTYNINLNKTIRDEAAIEKIKADEREDKRDDLQIWLYILAIPAIVVIFGLFLYISMKYF